MQKKFLLISTEILPEVFLKVSEAKELLSKGLAKNNSQAAKKVGISRSAFYKYKEHVFDAGAGAATVTIIAKLVDEPGALQSLLTSLSSIGANVVTINQSLPVDGVATVTITVRQPDQQFNINEILAEMSRQRSVVDLRQGLQD